jgi:hypothetical protein
MCETVDYDTSVMMTTMYGLLLLGFQLMPRNGG